MIERATLVALAPAVPVSVTLLVASWAASAAPEFED